MIWLLEILKNLLPNLTVNFNCILQHVFRLIIDTFVDLVDTTSPYFTRRTKILESVAALKCCVIMLDIDCEDLVLDMFKVIFSVIRFDFLFLTILSLNSILKSCKLNIYLEHDFDVSYKHLFSLFFFSRVEFRMQHLL